MNFRSSRDSILSEFPDLADQAAHNSESDAPNQTDRKSVPLQTSSRRNRRIDRDRARGYSINVKQVVLAFAVEFVIIALILISQFIYAAQIPNATEYKILSALLFPVALAMVELARVPLAIAVRTQNSWNIKFAALIGVICAVTVTSFSLSNIGHFTFDPRLEDAQDKRNRLIEAQDQKQSFVDRIGVEKDALAQKVKDRDRDADTYQKLAFQLNAQPGQNCVPTTTTNSEGATSTGQSCRVNPALKPLQNEVATAKAKVTEADAAVKQEELTLAKFDPRSSDEMVRKAEADYRTAVDQSQLHSYTAMLFRKDPRDVSDSEVKTLESYLIWIPAIAAAFSSTLIAMTAVHRIKTPPPETVTTMPDEAAAYLFGPLLQAIRKEASDAVAAAVSAHPKAAPT